MAIMAQAIRMALHYGEEHLDLKHIFGEDVGPPLGGVFTATQGLKTTWNTPLDERGIVGAAIGIALAQQRCVAEIQFCDYMFNAIDLLKLAGNTCWSSNGGWNLPMTVMTPVGSGIRGSIYHSHSCESIATHLPGWKIVMPSNPKDAYGLLLACLKDDNPCLFLPPKALMYQKGDTVPGVDEDAKTLRNMINKPVDPKELEGWEPQWPTGLTDFTVEIGSANITHPGEQLTVVSYGRLLPLCNKAAKALAKDNTSVEVIDLRTLWPYDWETVKASIKKTGKVIFINEDTEVTNFAEHLIRRTTQELWNELKAAPQMLAGEHVPGIGMALSLEKASVPQYEDVLAAIRKAV